MSTVVLVRCDNPACGVTDDADKQATYEAGWVEARIWAKDIQTASGPAFGREYHFHSWACLQDWVNHI